MERKRLNISEDELKELEIEEIVELKVEVDNLLNRLNNILETCDKALNY